MSKESPSGIHPHHALDAAGLKHCCAQTQTQSPALRCLFSHKQTALAFPGLAAQLHPHRFAQRHTPALLKDLLRRLGL